MAEKAWGGRRKGAGRPALFEKSADLTVRFDRRDFDALASFAEVEGVSVGELVRAAVRAYLARRKRG